jgi:hypothetical protein
LREIWNHLHRQQICLKMISLNNHIDGSPLTFSVLT